MIDVGWSGLSWRRRSSRSIDRRRGIQRQRHVPVPGRILVLPRPTVGRFNTLSVHRSLSQVRSYGARYCQTVGRSICQQYSEMYRVVCGSTATSTPSARHVVTTGSGLRCHATNANVSSIIHGRPHIGQMGSADPPLKMDEKLKSENMQKRAVFYVYILRAIMAGRCRERRYADHMFIQIYFRMHLR